MNEETQSQITTQLKRSTGLSEPTGRNCIMRTGIDSSSGSDQLTDAMQPLVWRPPSGSTKSRGGRRCVRVEREPEFIDLAATLELMTKPKPSTSPRRRMSLLNQLVFPVESCEPRKAVPVDRDLEVTANSQCVWGACDSLPAVQIVCEAEISQVSEKTSPVNTRSARSWIDSRKFTSARANIFVTINNNRRLDHFSSELAT